jgi:hypothetical protein
MTAANYSITVNPSSTLSIKSVQLPIATVGDQYRAQLAASGGSRVGYSFTASALPAGLTMSSTGLISGIPAETSGLPTTVTIGVLVNDSRGDSGFHTFELTLDPALSITPTTLGIATAGDLIHKQLTAIGGSGAGYTFKGIGLPYWLTLSPGGLLIGTPPVTAGATVDFSVDVTDNKKGAGSTEYTLQIDPAVQISPTTLSVVTVGNSFSTQMTAVGGTGTGYTFTATGIPAWMTLSGNGLLSGTPTSATGSPLHFTVIVTDNEQGKTERTYTLWVNPTVQPKAISLPVATVGDNYSVQLTPAGGSGFGYSFTSSNLPAGLTLTSLGLLSGMPIATPGLPTTVTVTITVTDSNDAAGSRNYGLTVDPALTISPETLGIATVGNKFREQLTALGGFGSGYSFKGIAFPSWLTVTSSGLLSGTPPATSGSAVNFSISVTDSKKGNATANYTLNVDPAIVISPTTLSSVAVDNTFSLQLTVAGGSGSGYSFSGLKIPTWMTLSKSGLLSGKPTAASNTPIQFSVVVADSNDATGTRTYFLKVNPPPLPNPATLPVATVGDSYILQLSATGGSGTGYSYSSDDLPSWLTLSTSGYLSGNPSSSTGSPLNVTIEVTDSNNSTGSRSYVLTVDPALSIGPGTLAVATAGNLYKTQLSARGGTGTGYSFKGEGLPVWLTLSPSGVLTGTPPANAPSGVRFSVVLTDSDMGTVSTNYILDIDPAIALDQSLPAATLNVNYSEQLNATGGSGTGYSFVAENLPIWLSLSKSGLLTGLPTSTIGSPLTIAVTVTDSDGATDTFDLKLSVQTSGNV